MCHVLVIEDEWFISEYISELASEAGATSTSVAATEREAVQAARDQAPDIIMSDVNLLEGTGPCAVATILGEQGPTPVIFITATPRECQPCDPLSVILSKPINRRAVIEAFRQLLPNHA